LTGGDRPATARTPGDGDKFSGAIGDPAQRAELSSLIVNRLEEGGDESLKFSIMKSRAGRERRERERKPANASTQFAAA
jgi:hypothetical protein